MRAVFAYQVLRLLRDKVLLMWTLGLPIVPWRLLIGTDRNAQDYIAYCEAHPETEPGPALQGAGGGKAQDSSDKGDLASAIARGLKEEAARRTRELLDSTPPLDVIERYIVPALDAVGRDYEAKRLFLPQLIKSAEAAKAAFECLRERLASAPQDASEAPGEPIALATVYGDVHDIGKNIVKVILENYNFRVLDLGKDVPPERVVAEIKRNGIRIVGLSALMTSSVFSRPYRPGSSYKRTGSRPSSDGSGS